MANIDIVVNLRYMNAIQRRKRKRQLQLNYKLEKLEQTTNKRDSDFDYSPSIYLT